jgi:hypothetical protein
MHNCPEFRCLQTILKQIDDQINAKQNKSLIDTIMEINQSKEIGN